VTKHIVSNDPFDLIIPNIPTKTNSEMAEYPFIIDLEILHVPVGIQ